MKHVGIAGVTAEGAFLCARTILAEAERLLPLEQPPEITLHMHSAATYLGALSRSDWPTVTSLLLSSIDKLRGAGADFAIVPANAVHYVIDEVIEQAPVPVLNLIEAVAAEGASRGYTRVAILGARWTMRGGLYGGPFGRRGIDAVVPAEEDQETLHAVITQELLAFRVREESTARLLSIVERLKHGGCQAIVLACTELPLALSQENCGVPVIDTTRLLAQTALRHAQQG